SYIITPHKMYAYSRCLGAGTDKILQNIMVVSS
ncbi:MAG: hypothetical protein ACI9RV_000526, partial [Glaciecola sp.]